MQISSGFVPSVRVVRTVVAVLSVFWLFVGSVAASTPVEGMLDGEHEWMQEHSPYLLSGEVSLADGGLLRIGPGVQVAFEAGASLRIGDAQLLVEGVAGEPVVFTSARAVFAGDGEPAPGDWGQLSFQRVVNSAQSQLAFLEVSYGAGVSIRGASPRLDSVEFGHNDGPALSLDLESSPTGQGLSAHGNLLNGILVPAGEIRSSLHWGLVGIPYVLAEGTLSVGGELGELSPRFTRLAYLDTATLRVELGRPAPEGGVEVEFSCSGSCPISYVDSVRIDAGETGTDVTVTAMHYSGLARFRARAAGWIDDEVEIEVFEPPALVVEPGDLIVPLGGEREVMVSLPGLEPGGTGIVTIANAQGHGLGFPDQIEVVDGGPGVLTVSGLHVGNALLRLQAQGHSPAYLAASVQRFELLAPSLLRVSPGFERSLEVGLSHPAPPEGLEIRFTVDDGSVLEPPAQVVVPAGETGTTVSVAGLQEGAAVLQVSADGYDDAQVTFQVATTQIVPLHLPGSSPVNDGFLLPVGISESLSLRLQPISHEEDIVVSIEAFGDGGMSLDRDYLTVGRGSSTPSQPGAYFVTGVEPGQSMVRLSIEGHPPVEFPVEVIEPPELRISWESHFSGDGIVVGEGMWTEFMSIERTRNGEPVSLPGDTEVLLASSNPETADASDYNETGPVIVIPRGQSSQTIRVRGLQARAEPVTLQAQAEGHSPVPVAVHVRPPSLEFVGLPAEMQVNGARQDFTLRWVTEGDGEFHYERPHVTREIELDLTVGDMDPLIDGFHDGSDPASEPISSIMYWVSANSSDRAYIGSPQQPGSFRVRATSPGGAIVESDPVAVLGGELQFNRDQLRVGRGFQNRAGVLRLEYLLEGETAPVGSALVVALEALDAEPGAPTLGFEASQVTLQPGSDHVDVVVQVPVDVAPGQYVIRATPVGSTGIGPVDMPVEVVDVGLSLSSDRTYRGIGGERDELFISLHPVREVDSQSPVEPFQADVEVRFAQAESVIDGVYEARWGGQPVYSTFLNPVEGRSASRTLYQGTGLAVGNYTIAVQVAGVGEEEVTVGVVEGELRFFRYVESEPLLQSELPASTECGIDWFVDWQEHAAEYGCFNHWLGRGLRSSPHVFWAVGVFAGDEFVALDGAVEVEVLLDRPGFVDAPQNLVLENTFGFGTMAPLPLAGLEVTDAPVEIMVSASGFAPPELPLAVSVVHPRIEVIQERNPRPFDDVHRAAVQVRVVVDEEPIWQPGSFWPQFVLQQDTEFTVRIADAAPASIVEGIVDGWGAPVDRLMIEEGAIRPGEWIFVPPPTSLGTYRIEVAHPDYPEPGEVLVEVIEPRVNFEFTDLRIDRSARTPSWNGGGMMSVNWGYGSWRRLPAPLDMEIRLFCEDSSVCSAGGLCAEGDHACFEAPPPIQLGPPSQHASFTVYGLEVGTTRLRMEIDGVLSDQWIQVEVLPTWLAFEDDPLQVPANWEDSIGLMRGRAYAGWGLNYPEFFRDQTVQVSADLPGLIHIETPMVHFVEDGAASVMVKTNDEGETVLRVSGPGTIELAQPTRVIEMDLMPRDQRVHPIEPTGEDR